ncbi:MAG TPA: BLUF domain-containing protein [Candidatus Omnitrophota bacterium]|nr:BLUF domain-containing protein [Candidatus Omnitrophota bacterium]
MLQVIYVSEVTQPVPEHQLHRMLEKSRANNRARNISGLLVRDGGAFLQVLEGPSREIEGLMDRIGCDGRHSDLRVLQVAPIAARQFDGSALAFVDTSRRISLPDPYLRLRPALRERTLGRAQARAVLELFGPGSAVVLDNAGHARQPAT